MSNRLVTDSYKKVKTSRQTKDVKEAGSSKISGEVKKNFDILHEFDLTLEYGPCMGISRLERWERAEKHGLNPPAHVRDLIIAHKDDDLYTQCLWNDYNI
ncbi:DNA polymerase delta subunit 4-like [Gigantopelta aegis]|uniref:DNA polymerase delta subunit 4-like n=1 Tax=Gigantopelta aegis TaxID=1735272 RepID=UPI001B88D5E5|nr:DNA polymerase delta subunit 4-like [Gigantopelta aegis]